MSIHFTGECFIKHFRNEVLIGDYHLFNDVTNEGKAAFLNTVFNGRAQSSFWYLGLINAGGFSGTSPNDTLASHPGWSEVCTYTNNTRIPWNRNALLVEGIPTTSGHGQVDGVTPDQPNITTRVKILSPTNITGLFLTDQRVCGVNSPGILWSTIVDFSLSAMSMQYGDHVDITYTLTISNNTFRGNQIDSTGPGSIFGNIRTLIDEGPF